MDARDKQLYRTVTINIPDAEYSETWMAENLNYKTLCSRCNENNAENCTKDGRLYHWGAATNPSRMKEDLCDKTTDATIDDNRIIQGVCPDGWHLPSLAEWKALIVAVDPNITKFSEKNVAGKALKSKTGWTEYSNNGVKVTNDDTYSFTALPAGFALSTTNHNERKSAIFWSSTSPKDHVPYLIRFDYRYDPAIIENSIETYNYSVRCIKNK